jgi:hypothetical protein
MRPYCDCSVRHVIQVNFLGFTISGYLDFLFVSLRLNVGLSLFLGKVQLIYVGFPWCVPFFIVLASC